MKLIPSTKSPTPAEDQGELVLERFLPYRLSVVTNRISGAIARLYAKRFRLTVPEWRVIAVLGRFGAMSANAVGDRTAMDKVQVSRAVARLIAAGRLDRRVDAADRRRSLLALSAQGRSVFVEVGALALAVEAGLLAQLDPGDRADLDRVLGKLEAAVARGFIVGADNPADIDQGRRPPSEAAPEVD
jgi:DNA-binding MarR family transcriptional regulator